MLEHVVILRWRKDASDASQAGRRATTDAAEALANIPGVTGLKIRKILGDKPDGYDLFLSVQLPDLQFLEKHYRPAELHQQFARAVKQAAEGVVVLDYEI
jgi:hypothetical protein